jgi:hypothetical protein
MRDEKLLQQAQSMNLAIDQPMEGAALAAFVDKLMSTPKSVTERISAIISSGGR